LAMNPFGTMEKLIGHEKPPCSSWPLSLCYFAKTRQSGVAGSKKRPGGVAVEYFPIAHISAQHRIRGVASLRPHLVRRPPGPDGAGLATSAIKAGVPTYKVRAPTGHASDAMLSRYVRDGAIFDGNAAGALL